MTKRSMLSVLAMGALMVASAAMAADTPAPKPAAAGEPQVHRVVVRTGGESADFEGMDELSWLEDDGDEFFSFGAGDEGEGGVQREVIVRRTGPGGGAMMFHGGGAGAGGGAACDDANCTGECGGHGGPGMHAGMGKGMGMGHPGMGQGMGRGMGMGRGKGHPGMMFAMLDLSDAQKAKMRDIHENAARAQIQARADMQIARMDMRKLMRADRPDQGAINAQIDKMGQMRTAMQKTRVATMLEARAQLTPDQLKKMKALHENGPMGGHPGMGMGGHPGMGMGPRDGSGPHGPGAATPKPKGK